VDHTSWAIWGILALIVLNMGWTLALVRISSTRIESRIAGLKIELAEWLMEQASDMDLSQDPPTPFQMLYPFIEQWLKGVIDPSGDGAKVISPRGEKGQFAAIVDKPIS
jgi:hypothetical protein